MLKNKTIYILSPEYWGRMFVSKHHYALSLAKKGNRVYFFEPPALSNSGITVTPSGVNENLFIVSYRPLMRGKRYLPGWMYKVLSKIQIRKLVHKVGFPPDVIWSFHPYLFEDLSLFNAATKIFHPVDFFTANELPGEAKTADICICSSEGIKSIVEKGGRPTWFINHGLSEALCNQVKNWLPDNTVNFKPKQSLDVGYIGNLLMEALDRETMKAVIQSNSNLTFHFWGQYETGQKGLGYFNSPEVFEFVEFLKNKPNVHLYGPVAPDELPKLMAPMDMFWICWNTWRSKIWNEFTNPHKILEYLSTGKPVVSHYMFTYRDSPLLDMADPGSNEKYLEVFENVRQRVVNGEQPELAEARMTFALNNSYEAHIDEIENLLNEIYHQA